MLKAGGYKSAESYVREYRGACERRGHGFDVVLARAARDTIRSCMRGIGGPVRAAPLPFQQLRHLPGDDGPWSSGGPLFPRNLMVLGAWFMLREVEAATAKVENVKVDTSEVLGEPRVHWSLPASKTDQAALGVNRSHGCLCVGKADPLCPAHAAWDQQRRLLLKFGVKQADGSTVLPEGLPFFPNGQGQGCSKE